MSESENKVITKENAAKINENKFVSLVNVNKYYDNGMHAVVDFNLDIKQHEFIVFVGPSGCGKSTTLRMIAGLEDISGGDLIIEGVKANDLEPIDRDVAMVFQSYALYPNMTIYDNMAFTLQVRHFPKEEIDRRVKEAARILEISDQLQKKPKALSGGQRQRVALGRAIVREAKILLMDEPLSNLDAKLRVYMRSEIVRLHEKMNATTIYVTHDQTEAMTMASRIVVMSKGVVQQIGTPEEIYKHPANLFVASFIGSPAMNFIDSSLKGNEVSFKDGHKFALDKSTGAKVKEFYENLLKEWEDGLPGLVEYRSKQLEREFKAKKHFRKVIFHYNEEEDPVVVKRKENILKIKELLTKDTLDLVFGVRPESIKENEKGEEFEVEFSELLGDEYYVHFMFGEKKCLAKVPAERKILKGDKIKLEFVKDKVHLFDPISERAIF